MEIGTAWNMRLTYAWAGKQDKVQCESFFLSATKYRKPLCQLLLCTNVSSQFCERYTSNQWNETSIGCLKLIKN